MFVNDLDHKFVSGDPSLLLRPLPSVNELSMIETRVFCFMFDWSIRNGLLLNCSKMGMLIFKQYQNILHANISIRLHKTIPKEACLKHISELCGKLSSLCFAIPRLRTAISSQLILVYTNSCEVARLRYCLF